ncbi:hypothetical protein NF27_JF00500 [Candidatus Jidaibacter acanthamoeba]|uniref:Uncharacterized protein n=1 Tax=Candidatus Jidaibacter acanthamoebae TaxID=86105 RepID=A0A0C1MQC4_9RICK|nr:hypothetical protein [Candidatus Jidaibacter acanthamoeba]KIE04172.1 hypothetical protein NF27_JF00500 [Candidatus Jidaibacter acanthamoeba]
MQVSQRLVDKGVTGDFYIGISKLCCPDCSLTIAAFNNVQTRKINEGKKLKLTEGSPEENELNQQDILELHYRDSHKIAKANNKWSPPLFMTKNKEIKDEYNKLRKEGLNKIRELHSSMFPPDSTSPEPSENEISIMAEHEENKKDTLLQSIFMALAGGVISKADIEHILKENISQVSIIDHHAGDNAFNQYDNLNYEYQTSDIEYIAKQLIHGLSRESRIKFIGTLGKGNKAKIISAVEILGDYQSQLEVGKVGVGVYNTNNVHWIAFCIIPGINLLSGEKTLTVLYKDSLGYKRAEFEQEIRAAYPLKLGWQINIRQIQPDIQEQLEEPLKSCGLFALKNMMIMAEQVMDTQEEFAQHYDVPKFYTPSEEEKGYENAIKELRKEFAKKYVSEIYENQVVKGLFKAKKAHIIGEKLLNQKNQYIEQLKAALNREIDADKITEVRIDINSEEEIKEKLGEYCYVVKLKKFENPISVISALNLELYNYIHLVSKDLKSNILKISPRKIEAADEVSLPEVNDEEVEIPIEEINKNFIEALNIKRLPNKDISWYIKEITGIYLPSYEKLSLLLNQEQLYDLRESLNMFKDFCARNIRESKQIYELYQILRGHQEILEKLILENGQDLFSVLTENTPNGEIVLKSCMFVAIKDLVNNLQPSEKMIGNELSPTHSSSDADVSEPEFRSSPDIEENVSPEINNNVPGIQLNFPKIISSRNVISPEEILKRKQQDDTNRER